MRVFVYEYTCAEADEGLAASLRAEGWAMLAAVLEDFSRVAGVECATLLPRRFPRKPPAGVQVREAGEVSEFSRLAQWADGTLVIAPESEGLLERCCRLVLAAGGRLLGPTPDAVALTADKLTLAHRLIERGVATPPVRPAREAANFHQFPAVCKPRFGAGSQATFLLANAADLARCLGAAREDEAILQPFVPGTAVSVAFLAGPASRLPLVPAAQHLSEDGRFRYRGGMLPLPDPLGRRAVYLALQAVEAVPGLQGYFGVDLVLGEHADGRGDRVIEINPRLTTSYVGLRRLARFNLAEAMLRVMQGEPALEVTWDAGPVRFLADGTVS